MWSQSEQSCCNSFDFCLIVVWHNSALARAGVTWINITSRPVCCQPVQPNSSLFPQRDGLPEMSVLAWKSCGEALRDVVKGTAWRPESFDKICSCVAAHITVSPLLALTPHPHIPHYRSNENAPHVIVKLLACFLLVFSFSLFVTVWCCFLSAEKSQTFFCQFKIQQ